MAKLTFAGPSEEEMKTRSQSLCDEFGYHWVDKKLREAFPSSEPSWRRVDYDNDLIVHVKGGTLRVECGIGKGLDCWSLGKSEDKADIVLAFIDKINGHIAMEKLKSDSIKLMSNAYKLWPDAPEDWKKLTRETLGKMGVVI